MVKENPLPGQTSRQKTFRQLETIEEIDAVNDAQKAIFHEIAGAHGSEFYAQRAEEYRQRWKEALAYLKPGSVLLDVGGGWPGLFVALPGTFAGSGPDIQ